MSAAEADKLRELLDDFDSAMLVTRTAAGQLRSRPMQVADVQPGGVLWFMTERHSGKMEELAHDNHVNVVLQTKRKHVSISGTATILESLDKKKALFNPMAKAWFPGGAEDPDLELVEIHIHTAQYWDVKDSKVTQVYKMAKAAVTGERPKNMGEHRELEVHGR